MHLAALLFAFPALSTPPQLEARPAELDAVLVVGRQVNLLGSAISASEGLVAAAELSARPRARPGDLLEYVPGLVATQHSGSGKANQYFLRGFNLDHGTDFATFVDGVPVNLPSHGHGQGYTDLNFLIPELVDELRYAKGPYRADVGNFGSAGSAGFSYPEWVDQRLIKLETGSDGYARLLATGGIEHDDASLIVAAEAGRYSGPWTDIDESVDKQNLLLKAAFPLAGGRAWGSLMSYRNRWVSPDQVPRRAVQQGRINQFGSIDTDLGGRSSRHGLSLGWRGDNRLGELDMLAYGVDYSLDLWSNFTYFLENPEFGDQFRQRDRRRTSGFKLRQSVDAERWQWRIGAELRRDDSDDVGLCLSTARTCRQPIRDDSVLETNRSLWTDLAFEVSPTLRGYLGGRIDRFDFDVQALRPENSGSANDTVFSPKASLIYAPSAPLELYASWGRGFHSNDARGTTVRTDPVSAEAIDPVAPLAQSTGMELGARYFATDRLHASVALWQLESGSELVFIGDAGGTEASAGSRRQGVEMGLYAFGDKYDFELEVQRTWSAFRSVGDDDEIPGAVPFNVSAGVSRSWENGWDATLRWRHVGAYPLDESGSVEADSSDLVHLRVGREIGPWRFDLNLLNLLDSRDNDIEYFYASRLPGEAEGGVEDRHQRIFEPRAIRLSLQYRFD